MEQSVASEDQESSLEIPGEEPAVSGRRHSRPTIPGEKFVDAIESRKKHPWGKLLAYTVGILMLLAMTNQLFGWPPSIPELIAGAKASTQKPAAAAGPSFQSTPAFSATANPTKTQSAIEPLSVSESGRMCPNPNPSDFKLPDVEICVTMWCQSQTYELDGTPQTDQTQIKLKASIFNKTTHPMDISITRTSAMRLLVTEGNLPDSWRPPQKTVKAGDRPVLVEWSGSGSKQNYWALPPNVYADSYLTPTGVYTGFYTQWDPPLLESGAGYYRPKPEVLDPANEDGNLVFQLPVGSHVYGLAVVDKTDPTKIIGMTPFSDWKDREVSPNSF